MNWVGIDYGSKTAGTTVIAYAKGKQLTIEQSIKNKDADLFVKIRLSEIGPECVYLDAPLSIPGVYLGKGNNYFYRKADQELKAMSPMFLGGLTARAMQLKAHLETQGVKVMETYPGALIRTLPSIEMHYSKKGKPTLELINSIRKLLPISIPQQINTTHQIDAIMAWYSGWRHHHNAAQLIGDKEEGLIII